MMVMVEKMILIMKVVPLVQIHLDLLGSPF